MPVLALIVWLKTNCLFDIPATGVPVVTRLPDINELSAEELAQWRFRAWSQMMRQLQLQNEPRVTLAFTSAKKGEGKSTLIGLLRDAAHDRWKIAPAGSARRKRGRSFPRSCCLSNCRR